MTHTQVGDEISFMDDDGMIIECTVTDVREATDAEIEDIVREHGGYIDEDGNVRNVTLN